MTAPETAPRQTSPHRGRRWLRRAGIGLTAVLVIVVALVGLLQLPPVATLAVRKLLTLAPLNPGNRLEVGRVSGNFLGGLTLEDLRLHQDGRELAHIDRLAVRYRLPQLRPPNSRLDELEILGGSISAHRRGDRWDLLDVMRKASDTTGGGGFAIGRLLVRDVAVAAELSAGLRGARAGAGAGCSGSPPGEDRARGHRPPATRRAATGQRALAWRLDPRHCDGRGAPVRSGPHLQRGQPAQRIRRAAAQLPGRARRESAGRPSRRAASGARRPRRAQSIGPGQRDKWSSTPRPGARATWLLPTWRPASTVVD